ncbi:acyl-CoA dehydrogenase family protein [Brevundimonas sp.]|uniref:acyl-CoA dehydrogenase family protein n=1 Tax=Brevundimonas sp. TaxID=1871086 RepID=UPI00289DC23B|nr:acyl-CoA dehydrogenase family protein [Brevundimonas sp.]
MNGAPDLDQEHESFRQSVRSFLDNHLTDGLRRAQRMAPTVVLEPEIYRTWHRILFEKGWVAPHWPQEFGGPGWSVAQRYIFEQECAAADAPLLPTIGLRMVGPLIMRFGDDAQKAHYLPRILSGEDIWCQGFSEPGAGSDLAALTTKATRSSTGYTVNGVKLWTTYGHHANRMIALVRTATTTRKQDGISCLIIDMNAAGVTVRPILTIGGDHDVNEVILDDVRVGEGGLVGPEGAGWGCAKYLLEFERGIFSGSRLRRLLQRTVALADLPEAAWRRGEDELERRISALEIDVDTLAMTELRIMNTLSTGENPGVMSSMQKVRVSEIRQAITRLGVDILGDGGLAWTAVRPLYAAPADSVTPQEALVVLPEYLNARAVTIYGGAAEVQRDIIARSILAS